MQTFTSFLPTLEAIAAVLAGFGGFVAMCGYAYGQFFSGKNQNTAEGVKTESEVIQLRSAQIQELRDLVTGQNRKMEERDRQHNEEMRSLHMQLGQLQGQLDEKEKQNKAYLEILQNRSPELDKILLEIRDFMHNINNHLQEQKLENKKDLVVEATVTRQ